MSRTTLRPSDRGLRLDLHDTQARDGAAGVPAPVRPRVGTEWRANVAVGALVQCPKSYIRSPIRADSRERTLLILRDAFLGATRFSQFRRSLGIAPDVLTDAGRELQVVLGALQQWGDAHLPWPDGPTVLRCGPGGDPLHVGFVDDRGEQVDEVTFRPTAAYPGV
jgi:DNA-binding HxlR family transcriptional regulator